MPNGLPYAYSELNTSSEEIRLLHLPPLSDPRCTEEIIRCRLVQVPQAGSQASYAALSYMWGHRNGDQEIEVEGRTISVTCNLWEALRKLRRDMPKGLEQRVL